MRPPPKWTQFRRYPIVAGTVALAVGVTLAWWAKVDISPLLETADIRRGQLWRLLTSIFPHLDILHLAFNVYWIWTFGTFVEEVYGHVKTAGLFVLFAVGSNAFDFAFARGGVGLSGVGYGLFGLLWILSRRDDRFRESMDEKTVTLFIGWFVFCIVTTLANIFPVANVAHGAGAILGVLTGTAITSSHRRMIASTIGLILVFGLWGSTQGRPMLNLSRKAGYEEGQWGYQALIANRNQEAVRWFRDAVKFQPKIASYWYNLGIGYERLGHATDARAAYQRAHQIDPNNQEFARPLQN